MAQFSFGNIDESNTDGFDLAAMLENFEAAVNSMHSGNTEPSYKIAGMGWRDTSNTPHLLKIWTGTNWVTMGSLNVLTNIFTPYYQGAALNVISTLSIGLGLANVSGQLRLAMGLTTGIYNNAKVTVDANGNIVSVENATEGGIPVGTIVGFMGTTAPTGLLELNGATLNRTSYTPLFTHLNSSGLIVTEGTKQSTQFGNGNNATTFSLGDWRGEFLRGWDNGRGIDTARLLASFQAQSFESHTHSFRVWGQNSSGTGNGAAIGALKTQGGAQSDVVATVQSVLANGGSETRPRNTALMWCIKY